MPKTSRLRGRPKSFDGKAAEANTIQSLTGALDVLDVLATRNGMTLSELAATLSRAPSTVYRILNTFAQQAIVEIDPATQTWHIGPATFRLGSAFLRRSGILERARPQMRSLMESIGETANLGVERENMVLFVSQVEARETIRAFFPPGTRSPMHASGIGKALLSHFPENQLAKLMRQQPMEKFTERTITDPDKLISELAEIRARGYAIDNEEKEVGMRCIAAPIINSYGETVAGISVSGPTHRMGEHRFDEIGTRVRDAGRALSQGLGAPL